MMHMKSRNILILSVILMSVIFTPNLHASEDSELYFNAGVENYLQGDYEKALDNITKAKELDPQNKRLKEFEVKILLDASTKYQLQRDYQKAYKYILKAKELDPKNDKVNEMYILIEEVVKPSENEASNVKRSKKSLIDSSMIDELKETISDKSPAKAKRAASKPSPVKMPPAENKRDSKEKEGFFQNKVFTSVAVVPVFILLLAAGSLYFLTSRIKALKKSVLEYNGIVESLKSEKSEFILENERLKERIKYEHQTAERYEKEIKEKNRLEIEKMRAEYDLRSRKIEEQSRARLSLPETGIPKNSGGFMHQQKAKFLEYVGDMSVFDENSSSAVNVARERIASMAQNLYEYAPKEAFDFLNKMAQDPNPLIRANIINALGRLARKETLALLFKLYEDPDIYVKREVLRSLKWLKEQVSLGLLTLQRDAYEKVESLIALEFEKGEWVF